MILFPAIDILNGRAVRLYKGDKNAVTDYGDPLAFAEKWVSAGAEWLHVVDLSGAFSGESGIDRSPHPTSLPSPCISSKIRSSRG